MNKPKKPAKPAAKKPIPQTKPSEMVVREVMKRAKKPIPKTKPSDRRLIESKKRRKGS